MPETKNGKRVTLRITPTLHRDLQRIAKRERRTFSGTVRWLLERNVEDYKTWEPK